MPTSIYAQKEILKRVCQMVMICGSTSYVDVIISNLYFCWLFEFLIMYVEFYQKYYFPKRDSSFFSLNNSYV